MNIPTHGYWGPANAEILRHETLEEAVYYAYDDVCPVEGDGVNAVVVEGGDMREFPASLFVSTVDDAMDYVHELTYEGYPTIDDIKMLVRRIPDDIDEISERTHEYADPTYFTAKTMKRMERLFRRSMSKAKDGVSHIRAAKDLRRRVHKWARTYPKITQGILYDLSSYIVELDPAGEIVSVRPYTGDNA